jgi:hypothetical protein
MQKEITEDLVKIGKIFHAMRTKMLNSERYRNTGPSIDKFYEALRLFTHEIDPDFVPPCIPVKKDEDDWLNCRC